MALCKGDLIKLISADQSKVIYTDWINSRGPTPGDIALVEEVFSSEGGQNVLLLCEGRPGFLEWRTCFHEAGLIYELLPAPTSATSRPS